MPGIGDTNRLATLYEHTVAVGLVHPTLGAGIAVQVANADWTYGNYATVVGAGVITSRYHVHSISIEYCNQPAITPAVFELELYHGATDIPLSSIRFAVVGGFFGNSLYPISSALVGPSEQIRARAASSDGLANQSTLTISICYCIEE
jgi:hypothetical protein